MCPHFLFTTAIDFIRLARVITLFMTHLFYILNYKRRCPLVPLFGIQCEICLSVTNV